MLVVRSPEGQGALFVCLAWRSSWKTDCLCILICLLIFSLISNILHHPRYFLPAQLLKHPWLFLQNFTLNSFQAFSLDLIYLIIVSHTTKQEAAFDKLLSFTLSLVFSLSCKIFEVFKNQWNVKRIITKDNKMHSKFETYYSTVPANGLYLDWIVQFQEISILPPEKGLEFSGGWRVLQAVRLKNLKKCMKLNLNWNFQRGGVWIFSGITHKTLQKLIHGNIPTLSINCILHVNENEVFMRKSRTKTLPYWLSCTVARSILQGRGLGCSCKDWTFEVNALSIIQSIWLFAICLLACNRPVVITGE